jgi:hypothetical protein
LIALLASVLAAQTQPQTAPGDKTLSGQITPERVKAAEEAEAKKAEKAGRGPAPRAKKFYWAWGATQPIFEGLGRNVLLLLVVWTQKAEELPVKRVYLRVDGEEKPLDKISSWKTPVDSNSITAKMAGANREDGFYLVPFGALLKKGQIVMDLSTDRTDWVVVELPSSAVSAAAKKLRNVDEAATKPDLKTLQALIRRKFSGFPVPDSLP